MGGEAFPESEAEECEGEECPGNGVGHVAREVAIELEDNGAATGRGEGIGDFNIQKEEEEDAAQGVEHAAQIEAVPEIPRGLERPGPREHRAGCDTVGVELPVENGCGTG